MTCVLESVSENRCKDKGGAGRVANRVTARRWLDPFTRSLALEPMPILYIHGPTCLHELVSGARHGNESMHAVQKKRNFYQSGLGVR